MKFKRKSMQHMLSCLHEGVFRIDPNYGKTVSEFDAACYWLELSVNAQRELAAEAVEVAPARFMGVVRYWIGDKAGTSVLDDFCAIALEFARYRRHWEKANA